MHSLARYSKRTAHTRRRVPIYNQQISSSFYSRSRVLFSVPSRYYMLSDSTCIQGWRLMSPKLAHQFQDALLKNSLKSFLISLTGLSPSKAFHSRKLQVMGRIKRTVLKHHISITLLQRIQFALFWFRSLLLTESQLVSFPAGTKTFQFPALLLRQECFSEVTFGNLGVKGCMRLTQAYRSLPRPSSSIEPSYPSTSVGSFLYLDYSSLIRIFHLITNARTKLCTVSLNVNITTNPDYAPGSGKYLHLPIASSMLASSPQGYAPPTIQVVNELNECKLNFLILNF